MHRDISANNKILKIQTMKYKIQKNKAIRLTKIQAFISRLTNLNIFPHGNYNGELHKYSLKKLKLL